MTSRRYSPEEKAAAVRMVRSLRAELGSEQGTVARVARQLGYGIESVRSWVRQADIDEGLAPGVSTAESKKVTELEQEIRELKRANVILGREKAVHHVDDTPPRLPRNALWTGYLWCL